MEKETLPKPNPRGNNPGVQNFDLSDDQFTSDGIGTEEVWKEKDINSRVNDKKFLDLLIEAYNKRADLVKQWSMFFLPSSLSLSSHSSSSSPSLIRLETLLSKYKQQAVNQSTSKANHPKAMLYSRNPTIPSMDTPAASLTDQPKRSWIIYMPS
jgi:hypothetical protein